MMMSDAELLQHGDWVLSPPCTHVNLRLGADAPHAYQLGWARPVADLAGVDLQPGTWNSFTLPRQVGWGGAGQSTARK